MRNPLHFLMNDPSLVGDARRQTAALAQTIGFGETERGEVAIIVTEAANNLLRHAKAGELIVRTLQHRSGIVGLEMLALDRGPGISNMGTALRDGYSTGGTAGTGMGSIRRLSAEFDVHSAESGTVLMSRVWASQLPDVPAALRDPLKIGVVNLPLRGEDACGDSWSIRTNDQGSTIILVADGLGHGLSAADASRAAVKSFHDNVQLDAVRRMEAIHAALRPTRGAAVAVAELRLDHRELRFVGVGNISAMIVSNAGVRNLVSHNGTMGAEARKIQEFVEPWPAGGMLIMHSDGLGTQWRLEKYPGLRQRHPAVIAAVLYRDFRRERDDVTVLVASADMQERGT